MPPDPECGPALAALACAATACTARVRENCHNLDNSDVYKNSVSVSKFLVCCTPLPSPRHPTHLGNILGSERVRQAGGGRGLNRFSLCDKMLFDEIVCVNQDKILGPDHS